jgi:hypothetical protein
MLAILAFVGYSLATIFFFSGGAAAWKRIQTSKGWNSEEAMIFVLGAMAAIAFSIYFFIHYQGVPYIVPLAMVLAAPVGFMLIYALFYSVAATFWALRNFFRYLWAAIDWVATSGQSSKKSAKQDSQGDGANGGQQSNGTPPNQPAKRDSIFPDGF